MAPLRTGQLLSSDLRYHSQLRGLGKAAGLNLVNSIGSKLGSFDDLEFGTALLQAPQNIGLTQDLGLKFHSQHFVPDTFSSGLERQQYYKSFRH